MVLMIGQAPLTDVLGFGASYRSVPFGNACTRKGVDGKIAIEMIFEMNDFMMMFVRLFVLDV